MNNYVTGIVIFIYLGAVVLPIVLFADYLYLMQGIFMMLIVTAFCIMAASWGAVKIAEQTG